MATQASIATVDVRNLTKLRKYLASVDIDDAWIADVGRSFAALALPAARAAMAGAIRDGSGKLLSTIKASSNKNTAIVKVGGARAPYTPYEVLGHKGFPQGLRKAWKPSVQSLDSEFRRIADEAYTKNVLDKIASNIA